MIVASQVWLVKTYRTPRPRRNAAKPSAPPGRRAAESWLQHSQRPNRPFSSYLPPRAAHRQAQTCPVGQPQTGRQPRRQRRVARLSTAATVCTENHEKPRISPFRVPLPWPPGGGLGAGGRGCPIRASCGSKIKNPPATASQCSKAIRPTGRQPCLLDTALAAPPIRHFLRTSRQGQRADKTIPAL